ncbi:HAD-IB family hydrolase [Phenylobacterium sp.]|uniref:HAD-IB family hydrolase n=1 Tax=Phenylobacterium sp. TaxID=1871053 RepID=UPI002DE74E78|nr:HAD-IB family hydrolase [Phenylobacterium sp.]
MAQDRARKGANRPQPPSRPPLVAFDFDGTITTRDSFTAFLRWRAGPVRYGLGLLRLLPGVIAYLFHRDRGRIKAEAVAEFLSGLTVPELEADAEAFAAERAPSLLRPDALAAWRRWRAEGARLVIVSASPSFLVAPFAEKLGADRLLATELAVDATGVVRGAFATPNCRGPEKVARLRAAFGDDAVLKAAYGDTSGDREMLAMAEIKGFQVFKAKP